jgi:TRAP-type mannitol/chloroaromatic compound transport system permease small subunit|tara:strand:+ start:927 stop:1484 length:558 start_codon:yes stop_codon:yes gene_type:complete
MTINLQKLINNSAKYAAQLGGGAILASALLVSLEVLFRNLGVGMRLHSFELTNYAFAGAVAFSFAYAVTQRAHIRIDVLYQFMPVWVRAILDIFSLLFLAVLSTGMAYYAWKVVVHSARLGARPNSTLDIPLFVPQGLWALGLTWFALVTIALALRSTVHLLRGEFATVHGETGVHNGDADEVFR